MFINLKVTYFIFRGSQNATSSVASPSPRLPVSKLLDCPTTLLLPFGRFCVFPWSGQERPWLTWRVRPNPLGSKIWDLLTPSQPVSCHSVVTIVTGLMVAAVDVKQNTEQLTDIYVSKAIHDRIRTSSLSKYSKVKGRL